MFSFKRYFWLIKRQFVENATIYAWGVGVTFFLVGLMFVMSVDFKHFDGLFDRGKIIFSFSGLIFIVLSCGTFFENIASKYKKMFYFSLPVTPLERWTAAFTFAFVIFPLFFLAVYCVFDCAAVTYFNTHWTEEAKRLWLAHHAYRDFAYYLGDTLQYKMFLFDKRNLADFYNLPVFFVAGICIISVFTLGSFWLKKTGAVKTTVVVAVALILYVWLKEAVPHLFLPENVGVGYDSFCVADKYYWVKTIFDALSWVLIAPVCWVALYFKIKERQV